MGRVIIGMDPHKRSATIEMIDDRESVLAAAGSAPTGTATGRCSPPVVAAPERIWAMEGCRYGTGRHIAQRLVADGETVVDVPPKLSALRTRRQRAETERWLGQIEASTSPSPSRAPSETRHSGCPGGLLQIRPSPSTDAELP